MAFELKPIQTVKLDGRECEISVNAEQRLRLSTAKFDTEENSKRAIEIMASCFVNDEAFALEKLAKVAPFDLQRFQTYLIAGETGVKATDDAIEKQLLKGVEDVK